MIGWIILIVFLVVFLPTYLATTILTYRHFGSRLWRDSEDNGGSFLLYLFLWVFAPFWGIYKTFRSEFDDLVRVLPAKQ